MSFVVVVLQDHCGYIPKYGSPWDPQSCMNFAYLAFNSAIGQVGWIVGYNITFAGPNDKFFDTCDKIYTTYPISLQELNKNNYVLSPDCPPMGIPTCKRDISKPLIPNGRLINWDCKTNYMMLKV